MALVSLGLTAGEEAVYRALIDRPSASAVGLVEDLAMPEADVSHALLLLESRGLASRTTDASGERFSASSPTVAFGPLVRRHREDLRQAELDLAALTERYWRTEADRSASDLLEVVTGTELIAARFEQLQRSATGEVSTFVTSRTIAVNRGDSEAEEESMQRGVRYRIVIERAVLEEDGGHDTVIGSLASGSEIRLVERVPIKLIIADRQLAMVPMDADGLLRSALLVHRSGLLDALMALFERVWASAQALRVAGGTVVSASPGSPLDATNQQILTLLLAGLTDASISNQTGLSLRTIQRRAREMMDFAGVHTRLQLGWHAARAGWLPDGTGG